MAAHVSHNSGNDEWYTPQAFLTAARDAMGTIDLDPASNRIAQSRVKASTYYTKDRNGLTKRWSGNVWLNPPYSAGLMKHFIAKLCVSVDRQHVTQAIVLTNNATDTVWFQWMLQRCASVCFMRRRIRFRKPDGSIAGTPLQGQTFVYFGARVCEFENAFSCFGTVVRIENGKTAVQDSVDGAGQGDEA